MSYSVIKSILIGGCIVACGSACAPISSSRLEQRVDAQDAQLRQMQPQQADTWNEVQAMRQEINQLKGQLAEMSKANGIAPPQTPANASAAAEDPALGRSIAITQEPVTGIPPSRSPDSSAYAPAVATPAGAVAVTAPAEREGSYGLPPEPQKVEAAAPAETTWGQADPKPETPAAEPPKDIATALYEAGVNDFNARRYQPAERSFRDFLKNYPSNAKAASAQYYVGECLFSRNQFPQAALEYDTVIKKFPKSASAPGAYYKQAICFSKMKQPEAARMQMQAVISKFPKSAEAARAKTFLKTNK